jgi:hypothetical protein
LGKKVSETNISTNKLGVVVQTTVQSIGRKITVQAELEPKQVRPHLKKIHKTESARGVTQW